MGIIDFISKIFAERQKKYKCPNCGADVTLDMERCKKCGVRIRSMFRKKCPRCGNLNELDAKKCGKCGYNFEAEEIQLKKTYYICPICNYKSDTFLSECPACGTRFI